MLPDWMTGGKAKPAPKQQGPVKPEPGPAVPGPPVLDPSRGARSTPAPQRDASPAPSWLKDMLGMMTGALTPAAELAKESNPALAKKTNPALDTLLGDLASRGQADAGTREKLKPRGTDLKPQQMTREEYLGLPAEARAAVDFNTMLVNARAEDRSQRKGGALPEVESGVNLGGVTMSNGVPMRVTPTTTTERLPEGYRDVFKGVFGVSPSRVSSMGLGPNEIQLEGEKLPPVRPEVLAVLKQIGYKSEDPDDMRAFLKLDNGISQTDIDNYLMDGDNDDKVSDSAMAGLLGAPVKNEREQFVENIVGLTQKLEEKLAKGDKMIADFQTSALRAREGDRMTAGARVDPMETPFGFGEGRKAGIIEDVDGAFRDTYNYLLGLKDPGQAAADLQQFNTLLQEQGVNPGAFANYMSTRLDNNERYELPIGDGGGKTKYRTPDEYRELLGLARKEG